MKHALTLEHAPRWFPTCSCGWVGVARRRRAEAEELYRAHVRQDERQTRTVRKAGRRRAAPGPRQLTTVEQLPDALRPKENPTA